MSIFGKAYCLSPLSKWGLQNFVILPIAAIAAKDFTIFLMILLDLAKEKNEQELKALRLPPFCSLFVTAGFVKTFV